MVFTSSFEGKLESLGNKTLLQKEFEKALRRPRRRRLRANSNDKQSLKKSVYALSKDLPVYARRQSSMMIATTVALQRKCKLRVWKVNSVCVRSLAV